MEFTDGWDPLFIGYTAAVYFHTSDIKINSWTTQAKKIRGSMPPKFEVREILKRFIETLTDMGLRKNDRGRETHRTEGRDEVCHKEVSGTLRIGTGGNEARRERAGCDRLVICSSDGI